MATLVRAHHRPLLPSLVLGALAVGVVALAGWLMLLFIKGTVVLISYALGAALVVVPLLVAPRVLAGSRGRERWQRVATIAEVVACGAALCVVAHLLGRHGWLLVVLPAAAVLLARLTRGARGRRRVPGP
jgi:hypothetical protein